MKKIKIGKIINTHGIKGECKVAMYSDFDETCFEGELLLKNDTMSQSVNVVSTRMHKGFLLIVFKEIIDMNMAEAIKNYEISIDEEQLPISEEGFYNYELDGLNVINEADQHIGIIKSIEHTLAHDIIRVARDGEKDVLIPFVEAFIVQIDLEAGYVKIRVIEGLL